MGSESARRPVDRAREKPPIANDFALGYTYQDVLDTDQEGMDICTGSIITITKSST